MAKKAERVHIDRIEATNIDPRSRTRTVPMKVVCFGQPRTGTLSMQAALRELGYQDTYHMTSVLENPRDAELWLEALEAKYEGKGTFGKDKWDQVLGHCMATVDAPGAFFFEEIMDAYPEAKILLTVRDPESWKKSVLSTVWNFNRFICLPTWNPMLLLVRAFMPNTAFIQMARSMFRHTWRNTFPEDGVRQFHEHNDAVRAAAKVRGREVLEFDVRQGWEPLCKFLGDDVPADGHPFPRVNDGEEFKKKAANVMGQMRNEALKRFGATVVVLSAVTFYGIRAWKRF